MLFGPFDFLVPLIVCIVSLLIIAAIVGGVVALVIVLNKRRAPPPRPGPLPKVCAACGAENPPDYEFCERCGGKLG
jgi:hypothetical protein